MRFQFSMCLALLCLVFQEASAIDVTATEVSSAETAPEGMVTPRAEFEAASPSTLEAVGAQAFDVPQGPGDVAYQTVVRGVKVGKHVRVTTDSARFQLRWAGASRDGISYAILDKGLGSAQAEASSDSASVQWSEIRRFDVRGRATGTGWPIGLVVGALGGIAAGVGLSQISLLGNEEPSRSAVVSAALQFGAVGAVGGAFIGAIIGSAFPKWHVVYKQK